MAKFFETEEDKLKAIRLVAAISQMGSVLDEICFTPLRDIQVFFKKVFGSMSGPGEPIITALLLAGSFTAAIPYLAKVFNENDTTTLQDLLANCDKECGTEYLDKNKKLLENKEVELKQFFQAHLNENNMGYLTVDVARKDKRRFKHFFRKEEVCDIKYKFNGDLSEVLHADEAMLKYIRTGNITHEEIQQFIDNHQDLIAEQDALIEAKNKKLEQSKNSSDFYNIAFFPEEAAAVKKLEAQKPEMKFSEFLEKVKDLDDSSRNLLKNMIPTEKDEEDIEKRTLAHGRKTATSRVKDFKLSDAPLGAYEATNGVSFQYWLAFFVFDMMYSQDDATKWNLTAQFAALGAAVVIFAVKVVAQIKDWWNRRKKEQQTAADIKDGKDIQYANKSLKQKQLTSFFNKKLKESNEERLKDPAYRIAAGVEVNINYELPKKSLFKRIRNKFFSIVKRVDEYENILDHEIAKKEPVNREYQALQEEEEPKPNYRATATRVLNALNITTGMGIGFSFIEWVLTVGIAAIYLAKTGAQTVSNWLDGLGGGLLGICSFVLGTILGIAYYNKKVKPGLDQAREALANKYKDKDNAGKIARLKVLEQQNTAMRKELKRLGVKLLPTMKIYDDRAYRRITTEKTKGFTFFKKAVNRFSVFVGKAGTGILLFRFLPLAICGLAGISLATAVASVFWPITIAALVVGLAWGIMYTYKYIQERRIESAKRFLDRLDVTLETAEAHNVELREQCKPLVQPVAVRIAAAPEHAPLIIPEAPRVLVAPENTEIITAELPIAEIPKFPPEGKWSPNIFAQKHCRAEAEKIATNQPTVHQTAPAC